MIDLRPYAPLRMVLTVCGQCFADDPNRAIDYETEILQGSLVAMDGKVYLRRTCRARRPRLAPLSQRRLAPLSRPGGAPPATSAPA